MEVSRDFTVTTAQAGRNYRVVTMPVDINLSQLDAFYRAYTAVEHDEALRFGFWDFIRLVQQGHIVCALVEEDDAVICLFGMEVMVEPMVHLSFLFWAGKVNEPIAREMLFWCWNAVQHLKLSYPQPEKPGAVRIVGRAGWRRLLRKWGFVVDADGYIREDQQAVRDGIYKRLI